MSTWIARRVSRRILCARLVASFSAVVASVLAAASRTARAQEFVTLYSPKVAVPRQAYRTWSLFLINNPQWVVAESNDKVKRLYDQFEAFGNAIGRDHVAVWFWSQANPQDAFLYKAVDVIRCAEFCQRLMLPPSGGPYVVVTTEYPGAGLLNDPSTFLPAGLQHRWILSLNNKSADEIMQLFTRLADRIVANRLSDFDPASDDYWTRWQRAFEAIRDFLSNRQMTVSIKANGTGVEIK